MTSPWLCEGCKRWLPSTEHKVTITKACVFYGLTGKPPSSKIVATIRYCKDCC